MNYVKLSKNMSHALRHAPWEYKLTLDSKGFALIEQLLNALNESGTYDKEITINDIEHIIEISDKKRFEIQKDKIRALYGHSIPSHIAKKQIIPSDVLYHGTTHRAFQSIINEGLKPMNRQYVHLSTDIDTAIQVGKRRDDNPIILTIDSLKAYKNGIKFYQGNDNIILADYIPKQYIMIYK